MKENNKKYWKGLEELNNTPEFLVKAQNEFPEYLPVKEASGKSADAGTDRRDFLKLLGFGVAAASLAACEAPVKKAIPYLNKPVDVEPGVANWYASTYMDGGEYVSVLVKTREGRPIKIEGNKLSKITKGGTSARAQASVLSLYDSARLTHFTINGKEAERSKVDADIINKLNSLNGGAVRIVSSTILSPTTKKVIAEFAAKYPNTEHVVYDAHSVSGLLKANKASFGKAIIPSYDFSKAFTVVSFGADFLGTWISPVEYASQYITNKKLGKSKRENGTSNEFLLHRHYQFETNMTITGSMADYREPIKPSEEGLYVAALYQAITGGGSSVKVPKADKIKMAAEDLKKNRGKSIVVSGSNDVNVQIIVNEINKALGNIGTTIDVETPSYQRQGDDEKMVAFIEDVKAGKVGAVFFYNANPVYDHPMGEQLASALRKVDLTVSFADRIDETAQHVTYVCPDLHYLESWNDAEPKRGQYSIVQPTIAPIFKELRQAQESLLVWSGNKTTYYDYLINNWKQNISKGADMDKILHDGVFESAASATELLPGGSDNGGGAGAPDVNGAITAVTTVRGAGVEMKFYEKVGIAGGSQANNPWLQELPDPISKATWGNYVAVPISYATEKKLKDGDVVSFSANGKEYQLPVLVQPGQAPGTVSVAIGYGRTAAGKAGNNVGVNVYPLISFKNGSLQYVFQNVDLKKTGDFEEIAQTQTHQTIMGRAIIQDSTLKEYQKDAGAGRYVPMISTAEGKKHPKDVTVWYEHEKPNHLWGMIIDLNSCIGCSACVIGCQSENNIPVVGKKEVLMRREMHWLRIDRYYSSPETLTTRKEFGDKGKYFQGDDINWENPEENPEVTFQPMLCQHCNHAPCETVCPVAATTHSSDGLNMMAYNRCIGTRYCANNCPYKVRRFNWFKYFDNGDQFGTNTAMNTQLGRMVLNPDVTVRSRGVMEKCTFCVQRIQDVKLTAKREKRRPADGEVQTACASACPTGAILFGDLNDPNSEVSKQLSEENRERAYSVLEEVNTRPNIAYLTRIRNKQA